MVRVDKPIGDATVTMSTSYIQSLIIDVVYTFMNILYYRNITGFKASLEEITLDSTRCCSSDYTSIYNENYTTLIKNVSQV